MTVGMTLYDALACYSRHLRFEEGKHIKLIVDPQPSCKATRLLRANCHAIAEHNYEKWLVTIVLLNNRDAQDKTIEELVKRGRISCIRYSNNEYTIDPEENIYYRCLMSMVIYNKPMHAVVLFNSRNGSLLEVKVPFDSDKFHSMFLECLSSLGYIEDDDEETETLQID